MTTLTDFLLARIAEDEAVAREVLALHYGEGRWHWGDPGTALGWKIKVALMDERGQVMVETPHDGPDMFVCTHIARHDPARVLAECEAKRRIVTEFTAEAARGPAGTRPDFVARYEGIVDAYRVALRAIASVYADHPDFDPAWAV